jgi:hypothetical protein
MKASCIELLRSLWAVYVPHEKVSLWLMQTRFNCASVYLKIGTVGQIWVEVFHIEFKQNLLSFLWDRGTSPFVVLSRPVARP